MKVYNAKGAIISMRVAYSNFKTLSILGGSVVARWHLANEFIQKIILNTLGISVF